MGLLFKTTKSESNVLKLVHPGGFVELHANPVTASEVMNRYPRHCVTRPDFFRFPWIVVSPESILKPGNVFFIVPCHTIRHLLKSTHRHSSTSNTLKQHRDRPRKPTKTQCFQQQSSTSTLCMKLRTPKEGRRNGNGGNKVQSFVYSSEYPSSRDDTGKLRPSIPTASGLHHSEQVPKLKSCLKKDQSNNARSRNLKVTFACNLEEDST